MVISFFRLIFRAFHITMELMKKFLFVSDIGCIGDLAHVVKTEGNQVRYCILDRHEKNVSDGFEAVYDDVMGLARVTPHDPVPVRRGAR